MTQGLIEFASFKTVKLPPGRIKEGKKGGEQELYPPRCVQHQGHSQQKRHYPVQQVEYPAETAPEKDDGGPLMRSLVLHIITIIVHDKDIRGKQSDRYGQQK